MDELKTLADMELFEKDFSEFPLTLELQIKDRLKHEAIKWVNHFRTFYQTSEIANAFIKFFNLDEEELGKQKAEEGVGK